MKLSEAIRLGAMMKPQGFGGIARSHDSSCALGAACDALGIRPRIAAYGELWDMYPFVFSSAQCPHCDNGPGHVFDTIWHLNDRHRWTREAIADWLETFERAVKTPDAIPEEAQIQ